MQTQRSCLELMTVSGLGCPVDTVCQPATQLDPNLFLAHSKVNLGADGHNISGLGQVAVTACRRVFPTQLSTEADLESTDFRQEQTPCDMVSRRHRILF